jgi:hypothetical protein
MTAARLITLVFVAVFSLSFGMARAEESQNPVAQPVKPAEEPKAVRMGDEELDKVTAGFTFVLLDNPGHASKLKVNNNVLLCINCGIVGGTIVHVTPNGVRTTCVGAGSC